MEQDRENRRKERGGKIMKTLEQEVLKKIAKKSLFVKLVNTERNESLVEQSISKEFLDLSAVRRRNLCCGIGKYIKTFPT